MNEQIYYNIRQASKLIFPDRSGTGGEQALRRMVKKRSIASTRNGKKIYISRNALLEFGIDCVSEERPALCLVETPRLFHKTS